MIIGIFYFHKNIRKSSKIAKIGSFMPHNVGKKENYQNILINFFSTIYRLDIWIYKLQISE